MKLTIAQAGIIETQLRLLGAKVEKVSGVVYFVRFELEEGLEVAYTYNINTKDKYFLQRIKPYPIPEGLFSDQEQVVAFIKRDIEKFKNARNSSNFQHFVELAQMMNHLAKDMESLFLNYNVEGKHLEQIIKELNEIRKTIVESKASSTHVVLENLSQENISQLQDE